MSRNSSNNDECIWFWLRFRNKPRLSLITFCFQPLAHKWMPLEIYTTNYMDTFLSGHPFQFSRGRWFVGKTLKCSVEMECIKTICCLFCFSIIIIIIIIFFSLSPQWQFKTFCFQFVWCSGCLFAYVFRIESFRAWNISDRNAIGKSDAFPWDISNKTNGIPWEIERRQTK